MPEISQIQRRLSAALAVLRTSSTFNLTGLAALAALICLFCPAASATRQAPEMVQALKALFPDLNMRLDGAMELPKNGDLYLPVMPTAVKKTKVVLLESFPAAGKGKPEALLYDNGIAFIKVSSVGKRKTFPSLANLSERMRKAILAGHLADDLIVPEGFSLPPAWKTVVGQTTVPVGPAASQAVSDADAVSEPDKTPLSARHGGIFLTSRNTGVITLVEDKSWKVLTEFPTEGTPAGMVYVNGRIYIADQSKNRILILDPVSKKFVGQIDLLPRSAPKAVLSLPNGKLLYVSESGTADVAVIEVETAKVLLRTKVGPGPSHMAITPNGNTILVLNSTTGQVTFISTLNQKVLGVITVGANPSSVVIAADGLTAYVSCRGTANRIAVIDIPKRGVLANLKTGNGPTGLAISADGATLYNAVAKDNMIAVFDTATRSSVKQIKLPLDIDFPGNITLTPDGKKLLVSSATTTAFGVLDVASGEFEAQPVIKQTSDEIIWAPID